MATERTEGNEEGGSDMTERYTRPSAKRIADLLPHRVSFARGWFWTTTAICHGGRSDGLAFRQRPAGEGIDVRCHTGGCSRGAVTTHLEAAIGLPIWTAYEQLGGAAVKTSEKRPWRRRKRVIVAAVVSLVVVQDGADPGASTPYGAFAPQRAAVPVEGSHSHEGGDLPAVRRRSSPAT